MASTTTIRKTVSNCFVFFWMNGKLRLLHNASALFGSSTFQFIMDALRLLSKIYYVALASTLMDQPRHSASCGSWCIAHCTRPKSIMYVVNWTRVHDVHFTNEWPLQKFTNTWVSLLPEHGDSNAHCYLNMFESQLHYFHLIVSIFFSRFSFFNYVSFVCFF